MTRLEHAALDYAIACLARGQRPESLSHLTEIVSGDAYSRAVQEIAHAECARRRGAEIDGAAFVDRVAASRSCTEHARRIVRAWLALYLRRVRRGMAFERWHRGFDGCSWSIPPWPGPAHPLWLDAPAHEPGVTARQRRERCPECGRGLLVSPMPVCIQCHRESA